MCLMHPIVDELGVEDHWGEECWTDAFPGGDLLYRSLKFMLFML